MRRLVGMVVFSCATCRQRISPDLREVLMPATPLPDDGVPPALMERGEYAVSEYTGGFVLHPDDVAGLVLHPSRRRRNGCCGLDGLDGPNLVCGSCTAEVATQRSDCWAHHAVELTAGAVTAGA